MRIELIRTVRHDGHTYTKGDVITASEGLGTYFCSCGWAKDVSGQVATAEAPTDTVTLDVHKTKHATKAKEIGNG